MKIIGNGKEKNMMEQTQNASKQMFVTGKLYRNITIYDQGDQHFIYGTHGQKYSFNSFGEAKAFVDTWYTMQSAVERLR